MRKREPSLQLALYNIVVLRQFVAMRLLQWRRQSGKRQGDIAPLLNIQVSQLSKIERGETFVSAPTGDAIRKLTDGAVTLDDLHDQWREYQAKAAKQASAA